ncbi:MAG: D-alanyl-D-alanine carboxypeptidase family protein [Actinomycetota bacterium]|nr:D-alanyl-D-alanine carboxypeptidase family protein [Actinomycetota bacterium]
MAKKLGFIIVFLLCGAIQIGVGTAVAEIVPAHRSLSKYSTPAANPVWRPPAVLRLLRVATATRRPRALPDDSPSEFSLSSGVIRQAPSISSPSAFLLDVRTGRELFSKEAYSQRPIASTTKILTALVVMEKSSPNDEVVISANAASTGGATIGLKQGERRKVGELLEALMLASANDAAVALAEHVGGSVAGFARIMNETAQSLGAKNSRFMSPNGLAPGNLHYSTAEDLARIAQAAMKKDEFRMLVSTRRYTWETTESSRPTLLTNSNNLLEKYPPATGIKTGYTNESGYCLVASATKGERSAIAVILGSPSRDASFNDARQLLDWALDRFEFMQVVKKSRRYGVLIKAGLSVPLVADKTWEELVYNGADGGPVLKALIKKGVKLPITKGQRVGELAIMRLGKKVGSVGLLAGRSAADPYVAGSIQDYFRRVVKKIENLL